MAIRPNEVVAYDGMEESICRAVAWVCSSWNVNGVEGSLLSALERSVWKELHTHACIVVIVVGLHRCA